MVTIKTSVVIEASAELVFQQLTNVANNRDWMKSVSETVPLVEGPLEKGSQFDETGSFLGVSVSDRKRVTAFAQNSVFGFVGNFVENAVHYTLVETEDGQTLLHVELTAQPPIGLPNIAKRQIIKQAKRRTDDDLSRLKALVERQADAMTAS